MQGNYMVFDPFCTRLNSVDHQSNSHAGVINTNMVSTKTSEDKAACTDDYTLKYANFKMAKSSRANKVAAGAKPCKAECRS